jgi:hypothetical protein
MFGIAATSGRCGRRRLRHLYTETRDHLWDVVLVGLGCAAVGVCAVAQIRLGSNHATAYLALDLALPVLSITALASLLSTGSGFGRVLAGSRR